jgi:hypothetical protein
MLGGVGTVPGNGNAYPIYADLPISGQLHRWHGVFLDEIGLTINDQREMSQRELLLLAPVLWLSIYTINSNLTHH